MIDFEDHAYTAYGMWFHKSILRSGIKTLQAAETKHEKTFNASIE